MNEEIGAEAAQFPEKEYINGIAIAVQNRFSKAPMTFFNRKRMCEGPRGVVEQDNDSTYPFHACLSLG
jgi:hypothetical protein